MTTLAEAYFLIRVGQWGEDEVDDWIRDQLQEAETDAYDSGYEAGYKEGHAEGLTIGAQSMYEQAFQAIKDLS